MKKIFTGILFLLICVTGADVFAKPLKKVNLLFEDRDFELNFVYNPNLIISTPQQFLILGDQKIALKSDALIGKTPFSKIETEFKTVVSETELKTFLQDAALLKSIDSKPVEINLDPKTDTITFSGDPIFAYDIEFELIKTQKDRLTPILLKKNNLHYED